MNNIETIIIYDELYEKYNNWGSVEMALAKIYYRLYGNLPHKFEINYDSSKKLHIVEDFSTKEIHKRPDLIGINCVEFYKNVRNSEKFKEFPYMLNSMNGGNIYIGDHIIFVSNQSLDREELYSYITVYTENSKYLEQILDLIPEFYKKISSFYNYVSVDNNGNFGYSPFKINKNSNVSLSNYNEDVPYNEYLNFCNSDECGLSLMYGKPGTGKTTLIKKLINNSKTNFFLLDASLLGNITSANFVDFLLEECKNSVFILEDCEKLLLDRNTQYNPWIGTILNLTDGMLGEGLNIKFICTFNAPINSIDPALLRKGRLKVSYEFKPLDSKRVENLGKEIHKDIHGSQTLADIYGTDYTNSSSLNKTNKIGF